MPKNSHEGEIIAGLLTDAEGAIAQGALAKASAVYRGILTLDPDHVVALRQLAALAIEFGDPRAAAELFAGRKRSSLENSPARRELIVAVTRSSAMIESTSCPDPSNTPVICPASAVRVCATVQLFWIVTSGMSR